MPQETINCVITRVIYQKEPEGGKGPRFVILGTSLGKAKGRMSWEPKTNERVALVGMWQTSKFDGSPEFSFAFCRHDIPVDSRSQLRYVCELSKGIGPAMEEAIWKTLGDNWRDLGLDSGVPRISASVVREFHAQIDYLTLTKEKFETISYLISKGATTRLAESAWDAWENKCLAMVEADCYCLADLANFSFRDVDQHIRVGFGIGDHDTRRINAAIMYYMKQGSRSDTVVLWPALCDAVQRAIAIESSVIASAVRDMFKDGRLVPFKDSAGMAIPKIYKHERIVWDFVKGA